MIHEFVERIVVHEGDKTSGERIQKVDVYLNFIGKFDVPMEIAEPTAEEMAAAAKLQKQRERKRKNFHRYVEKRQQKMAQEQIESLQNAKKPQNKSAMSNVQAGGNAHAEIEAVS